MSDEDRKPYRFDTRGRDHWEAVRQLADEVGWDMQFEDAAIDKLRAENARVVATRRGRMDRLEFVRSLCKRAGIEPRLTFTAP